MAITAAPAPKIISLSELDAVLDQARAEGWRELALHGPGGAELRSRGVPNAHKVYLIEPLGTAIRARRAPKAHKFYLIEPLGTAISKLASLTDLTCLDVSGNLLGDEGAHVLASLTGLTSLSVSANRIGHEGARSLATLTNLTFLDASANLLGVEGTRALTALTGLTSLELWGNQIEDGGARALAALTSLTALDASANSIGEDGARALAALTSLTTLDLLGNQIGAAGVRALASLADLTFLDLGGNRFGDDGARALATLTNLTALHMKRGHIGDDGARALATLTNLTTLDLSDNQIGAEGARALTALTNLTTLDLGDNQIGDEGTRALVALTGLTHLRLSRNNIGDEGTRGLAALTALVTLSLSRNDVGDRGARAFATLENLTSLVLWRNRIGDAGARVIASLTRLTSLDLESNEIGDEGARALAALTGLITLRLAGNRIGAAGVRALLDAWCDTALSSPLIMLDLRRNEDMASLLPSEVLESQDAPSILAAYRRYREAQLQPLNEAKLVVVGNEAVGKTSLIRYLVHGQPRDPDERKTPGVAIHEKIEVSAWSVRSQVRLNVWDFGGQEIMRGTHRFFLTERSLYLLVLEDRREDDRSIYEWLEIIAQHGGDSPVIVVVNKSDAPVSQHQLDEAALQRAYPVIAGFARTSCNAGFTAAASIATLRAQIAATLTESARLKHVRDPIPQSWLRVKDSIAALARARSVLPVRDFERLCEGDAATPASERITDPDEQRALLRLLHDLGTVVAHGLRGDAPAVRREITVLDPNWLTGAIYALINSPTVRDQKGELRHDQLGELLDPARYPPRWHELVVSMMQEPALGLCLPLASSGSPRYLLPDALPVSEPDYGGWPDSLRFRFQYSLLPTGFIPRFIVEAHRSLTDKPTWWRTGVVLGAEGCRILVRGDTARNRVEIHVAGTVGQRAALSVIRNYFEAVHRHYAKLTVSARVPLPDQPDVDIGYDHLITLELEEGPEHAFRPEGARRKYTVRELLEGVRHDEARHRRHDRDAPPRPGPDDHARRPSASPYRGKVDFGILTIREDENAAVLRRFPKLATEERQRRYRIRSLALPGGGAYTLAVLRCLEQGNTDAQAAAHALLEDLAPRFLLVIGIAGAVPSHELTLGDVVVSSRIADFSVEAIVRDHQPEYALGGGPLHPHAGKLAADVSAMAIDGELEDWPASLPTRPPVLLTDDRFYGTDAWQRSTHEKLHRHFAQPRPPHAITGAIASSDRLIKDDDLLSVWLKIARQVVAVEMESAGIYKASHERNVPFLAIRGISDVVGFRRDPDWTAYACETAAAFAHAFLRARPVEPLARL
ncbi:MAG TPA: COR domain-containing protein [Kofleriaceae bacterium]|nr:COR domain-containing protein [Kofleriaceae bacterium]